jgi:hypothetical protein
MSYQGIYAGYEYDEVTRLWRVDKTVHQMLKDRK